ncbi:MAG: manganese efflux pump [Butyrivibrio sp.]|nr:manganese efflux pump [Butyrivibrio sp.]
MILLIGFGLAFDVFGIAVSQGSVLGSVKSRGIVLMCLMVCAWQVVAMAIGYGIASLPHVESASEGVRMVWSILSALILIVLGGIKIFLIYFKKAIPEVRSDIDFKKTCKIASSTSIYTLFAGIACGFLMLNPFYVGGMICILTIGIVIAGVYVGYRNGELDKRVYWTGGILLIIAGVLTVMQYIVWQLHG